MENLSRIKAVGNASPEEKQKAIDEREFRLSNHLESLPKDELMQIEKFEYQKNPQELALIEFTNKEVADLMKEAGVRPVVVHPENYHIIPPDLSKKIDFGGRAAAFYEKQGILFNAEYFRANPVAFGSTALHETLHIAGFYSIQVNKEGGGDLSIRNYRTGVGITSLKIHSDKGNYHDHFRGLHEAIVATQQKKSLKGMLDIPELRPQKEWLESKEAEIIKEDLIKKGKIMHEDDIVWFDKSGEELTMIHYRKQREVLDYVCTEIQKDFSEKYKNSDEVFKEFLKAQFNGNLLTIGRLVEQVFGEGGFRVLGNMSNETLSGIQHLETLRNARRLFLKSKN